MADVTIKMRAKLEDRGILRAIGRELARYDSRVSHLLAEMSDELEDVFRFHAPEKSGRLRRGIHAIKVGDRLEVRAEAKDPESGYDYVWVSRFGHVTPRIYAGRIARSKFSEAQYTKAGGFRSRPLRGARALNTQYGFFTSVRGFQPTRDWAEPAYNEAQVIANDLLEEMGGDIVDAIGRGR